MRRMLGLAQPRRRLDHRVEYGLQLEGRAADHLEHVGGRGLLLERLRSSSVRACTSSNSRTFSIAITAWSAKVVTSSICLSVNGSTSPGSPSVTPIGLSLAQHWYPEHGALSRHSGRLQSTAQLRIGFDIHDLDGFALKYARPTIDVRSGCDRMLSHVVVVLVAGSRSSRHYGRPPSRASRWPPCRRAQPRRRLDQRIQHRLQVEGRAADDLEHVGGGGLLLQRFAQLVEQPHVLDGDDGLRGEIAQTSAICLSVNGRTSWR